MAPHQFHIGQTVYLRRSAFTRDAAPGIYEIRAVLPEEDGRRQYKIKSLIEPHERVVSEQNEHILLWWKTGYRFVKRQSRSDPNVWVWMGNPRPAITTATSR
jgi:Bacterial transglutaminase-like cysteine proteinase BTLCP